MEKLSAKLLSAFALALNLPENWFEDKIDRHRCALRALYVRVVFS
jgi:isopenicillin N synthase-like dioxygenase